MPRIQQLSASVVNKIAAGEVIERPASVVKELLENSIDAGATRVDVRLEAGGRDLIRVTDNGCGIEPDDLMLAVSNHATSKIVSADDLFEVGTMGFRGEALASIAEVSRTLLRTRTAEANSGAELRVNGGVAEAIQPAGCPVGTTIEVRDLFFNTPVRQRFLRTPQTEIGHATEAFVRIALANPKVHCRLEHGQREVHDLPPTDDWRVRIAALFGDELAESLIEVESVDPPISLRGYAANPQYSRANNRLQYLFLNGRNIRDRALQHALGEAYRGLLLTGRYPICFLRFDMPANLADVNVHPTKLEVRFQDGGRLYSQLLSTLRSKFLSSDLRAGPGGQGVSPTREEDQAAGGASQMVDWAKEQLTQRRFDSTDAPSPASRAVGEPLVMHRLPQEFKPFPDAGPTRHQPTPAEMASGDYAPEPAAEPAVPRAMGAKVIQLHNRYLIVETDSGMEIIDQHALHERILYEQIRAKVAAGSLETQALLVPEPVDLASDEAAAALEQRELLKKLGVVIEPFGGDTVLVSSYPAMLANLPPGEVLHDVVNRLTASDRLPEATDLMDDLLHTVACKAAVKYGDRLTPDEITALLEHRHLTQNHHHCPHGRPTALVFSCDDLDKQFKRI
ncbi:DNA mismatch repair endonuclease MutL [Aeoliella sp. ICT_H6.2]|uniref:DNA mismatch repair protein MutL n=1 Tax=Aeoliella straminimaris TaxID=2954799 RepID=A0A9X2JKY4_9BACT|nr:DNA mismatch repair endonuclease MutL [Aeoliella straminimaris]MCO6047684.1 DNA mismatch repair endonuclease MutL [Aeoliella straminimaris]